MVMVKTDPNDESSFDIVESSVEPRFNERPRCDERYSSPLFMTTY